MEPLELTGKIEQQEKKQYEIPEILNQKYYPGIDGLRAVSIIIVLSSHIFFNYGVDHLFDLGKIGVEIFFVISGFLITTLLLKEHAKKGSISLKHFYLRRFFRIVPVAVLFLLCVLILDHIFQLHITTISFFTALFYLKNLPIKNGGEWYTGHFWSLSIEEQFYLVFPLLLIISQKFAKRLSLFFIVLIPIVVYMGFNKIGIFYTNKAVHIISFAIINVVGDGTGSILIGCIMAMLLFENKLKINFNNKLLSLIIFLLALFVRVKISPIYVRGFSSEIFSFLIAWVVILNLNKDNYFSTFLNTRLLTKLGILSYSLYIWQQIFLHNQPWEHSFKYGGSLIFNLPILLIVAYLSYHFYEKKFLILKERFK